MKQETQDNSEIVVKQETLDNDENFTFCSGTAVKVEPNFEAKSEEQNLLQETTQSGEKTNFQCKICGKVYPKRKSYNDHMRTHKEATLACTICEKSFKEKRQLTNHIKSAHENPPRPSTDPPYCKECDKWFTNRPNYLKHVKRHGPRRYTCSFCPMTFVEIHHLKRHKSKVHKDTIPRGFDDPDPTEPMEEEDPVEAPDSEMQFSFPTVVKEELIIDDSLDENDADETQDSAEEEDSQNPDSVKCDLCEKVYKTKVHLRAHVKRMHTNPPAAHKRVGWNRKYHADADGLFRCDECGKSFFKRHNFSGHVMKHKSIRERKYLCVPCNKPFSTRDNLRHHEDKVHGPHRKTVKIKQTDSTPTETTEAVEIKKEPVESWNCEECDESFHSEKFYTVHMRKHKKEKSVKVTRTDGKEKVWKCEECDKEITNKRFYKSHLRRHIMKRQGRYKCCFCEKHCGSRSDLERHQQIHEAGNRPRVIKYIRGENGLFSCGECKQSFTTRNLICRHSLMHKYMREKTFACEPCGKAYGSKYALQRHEKEIHGEMITV